MSNSWISKSARLAIYARDGYKCCYCGKQCVHYNDRVNSTCYATLDHIVARVTIAKTCSDDKAFKIACRDAKNLVTICNSCNSSKQDTELYVWCKQTGKDYNAIIGEISRRTITA